MYSGQAETHGSRDALASGGAALAEHSGFGEVAAATAGRVVRVPPVPLIQPVGTRSMLIDRWVNYPGLPDHPDHAIAARQFRKDHFGGVLSFGVRGDAKLGAKVVDSLELASNLANVGDAKTVRH